MTNPAVAVVGSITSHGGVILTGNPIFPCAGSPIATIGSLHSCPVKGHGVNIVVTGSGLVRAANVPVATIGSLCSCGAIIISGPPTIRSSL